MRVGPSGPSSARIMLVGEAPGADEDRLGEPFVGLAGKLLRDFLQQVGIAPEECWFTNLCKWRPPKNKLHEFFDDGGIPQEVVRDGLAELMDELRSVRPNVVVALGNFPLHFLTGKGRWVHEEKDGKVFRGFRGITDWRGSILPCTLVPGLKVVATFHPSYIQQEGMSDHGSFKTDLGRVKREAAFLEIRSPRRNLVLAGSTPKVHTGYDRNGSPTWGDWGEDRDTIRTRLLSSPSTPTTLDIEYIGSHLICVGLGNEVETVYTIPTESLKDLLYMKSIVDETKSFNAQNSTYDNAILEWHYSLPIMRRVVYDTMICAYAANVELPKGLDYLCSIYTDEPYYKDMVDWDKIKKGTQSKEIVYPYNSKDVWVQHEVMEEQIKHELTDPAVRRSFDFLMRLLNPLWNMSRRGIRVDMDLMQSVAVTLDEESSVKSFELMMLAGYDGPINSKSGPEVAQLLYTELGLPILKMNKTGPATDDKTLAALQLKTDDERARRIITLIRADRSARDLKSKFFDIGFDDDGRMRGTYDPTKTVSGRLASRKFYPTGKGTNQQNVPRDPRARRALIADRGKVFGFADLEKADSVVVAHLTNDPLMLFDHSPGQNAHRNLGARLFGKLAADLDKDEYYLSKKVRHAGNYMQGWITLQRNVNQDAHKTGVSIESDEAQRFIDFYRDVHIGLRPWWNDTKARLWKGRTLFNLVGFPRIFYGHIHSILPEAVAHVPQSTVGQVINIGILSMEGLPSPYLEDRGIWQEYADIGAELVDCGLDILQQVHDSVGFQLWEKDVDRAAPLIRRALSIPLRDPHTYVDFRIPVEIQMDLDPLHVAEHFHEVDGRRVQMHSNWGDCKVYTKDLT